MNHNLGEWNAIAKTDGKAPQIIVTGRFPTNGEKPYYHLTKNEPQGINPEELILTLVFGSLVVPEGQIYFSASYTQIMSSAEQYKTVLIIDDSEEPKTIANLMVSSEHNTLEEENPLSTNANFNPYLEPLLGVEITGTKFKIRCYSGGCTFKNSFNINVIKGFTGLPPYIVEVYRIIPDYCKGHFPEGVVLEYELSDLGIEPFTDFSIANKIGRIR